MTSWKRPTPSCDRSPMRQLQWGHDDVVVEDDVDHGVARAIDVWLQWGHDDVAVEDGHDGTIERGMRAVLQWGHDDVAVEDAGPSTRRRCQT